MTLRHLSILCLLVVAQSWAQIHCGSVSFEPNTPVGIQYTFDSFSQYESGITMNNVATVRIRVEDQVIPDPDCRWFLTIEVDNSPGTGTASTDWETLNTYGTGTAPNPTLDILEFRVRNGCQTSPIDGMFHSFTDHGDIYDIIADMLPTTPAGSCTTNVNGPGNYLTNYNEFTFTLDVRVRPGYTFSPGVYELSLRFHLEEQM